MLKTILESYKHTDINTWGTEQDSLLFRLLVLAEEGDEAITSASRSRRSLGVSPTRTCRLLEILKRERRNP